MLTVSRTSADFDQAGWTSAQAIDGDTRSGWAIHPRIAQPHSIVLELATPLEISGPGHLAITLQHLYPPQHVMGRFRISITDAPAERARQPAADTTAALQTPAEQRTREQQAVLAAEAVAEYVRRQQAQLPARQTVYGVSSSWSHAKKLDQPQPPKTVHLLQRGDFQKPLYEVGPGSLSAIDVLPARFTDTHDDEALRRAALADWLVHPDNPLVWRSIVNRVWQFHFGQGLVDTPNDFGRMGGQPSHPDLLDWLAVWFRDEADGSLKQLHRLIMTSDAWQRSSGVGVVAMAEQRSRDADNRLLWRMNRQRLSADVFRDSVLQLSGRLDLTMGGPGVEQFAKSKGPQATPALDYAQFDWTTAAAGRRSIYRWSGGASRIPSWRRSISLTWGCWHRGASFRRLRCSRWPCTTTTLCCTAVSGWRIACPQIGVNCRLRSTAQLRWCGSENPQMQSDYNCVRARSSTGWRLCAGFCSTATSFCLWIEGMQRRNFLWQTGGGFAGMALSHVLGQDEWDRPRPQWNGGLHHPARVRRVIQLFMTGGVSPMDTYDYKPELERLHGQKLGPDEKPEGFTAPPGALMKSPFAFARHGESGRWVSSVFPHQAKHVDDMAFLMAMASKTNVHGPGTYMMNTGFVLPGFPCLGRGRRMRSGGWWTICRRLLCCRMPGACRTTRRARSRPVFCRPCIRAP